MQTAETSGDERYGYWRLPADRLQALVDALRQSGHRVLAPTLKDQAISIDEIDTVDALPRGLRSEQ